MNSIIMSIRPEWAVKEMNGIKTEEIRKNLGKLKPPFKVYAYVTKGKPTLYRLMTHQKEWFTSIPDGWIVDCLDKGFNGKVCFEFVCDRVERINLNIQIVMDAINNKPSQITEISQNACLTENQLLDYAALHIYSESTKWEDIKLYSLHISELKVYDRPKELGEFSHYKKKTVYSGMDCPPYVDEVKVPLTRAFQSWGYVEEKQDE